MPTRIGKYTLQMDKSPGILGFASIAGKKEKEGPLGAFFDVSHTDNTLGDVSWEKAESQLQTEAVETALKKAALEGKDVDYILAGDLLNQCISSTFGLRSLGIPFLGQYGACSTMAQTLGLASLFVETGIARRAVAVTSSHFCSAERQFRFPLEYGGQRTPTAQWTATAAGSVVVGAHGRGEVKVNAVTFGRIADLGIKDANNMGAAMAPAAAQTLHDYLTDTGTSPYERQAQDVHAGGSGCGCSAAVLCSIILQQLSSGELKKVLFLGTGALMSTTSSQQGESIPGIAHLVFLESQVKAD